ncbi:response regulator transcription factor [Halobacteriovorax vibrionivorans]|uniref:Response regulator transcription factor n=1 Tax=Halobacteriovorax vibrionivorans TaxID=2152716 RepID=A0ABY0ID88_9BACT|nr:MULTISPECIES: response regulator transcription factor [Halobacteriovorax]RZF20924.1 response regulator transcription factor [Halobacteriovorax vibrionivorans]TGD46024.1 response regulator transcription factor [Halobacteriovorax sp. Y22]
MDKLLLVEDDVSLGKGIMDFLKMEGFDAIWAQTLEDARKVDLKDVDLIIQDWMLPDGQGIDFLKELRSNGNTTPMIILTAKTDLIDKVVGLESGANDYMTKPFETRELLARIRVQLRIGEQGGNNNGNNAVDTKGILTLGKLKIDNDTREVTWDGGLVELTKMEFDFLKLLVENPNRALSRDEILNKVWGYECYPSTRTVDTHVLQLRQKFNENLIETVRGIGYKLRPQHAQ